MLTRLVCSHTKLVLISILFYEIFDFQSINQQIFIPSHGKLPGIDVNTNVNTMECEKSNKLYP